MKNISVAKEEIAVLLAALLSHKDLVVSLYNKCVAARDSKGSIEKPNIQKKKEIKEVSKKPSLPKLKVEYDKA